MWDAIDPHTGKKRIDVAFPKDLRASTRDHEMMITFRNGSTFQLVGSDNFNSLVGSPPVGLVFSEYALSDPSAWAYLMPIVEENKGWVVFNSTPRGNNHFKNLCKLAEGKEGWFCESLTAEQTGVFTKQQLQNILEELQAVHGDEYGKALWLQEYFVSFDAAIPGAYYADCLAKAESQGRIGKVDVDKDFPVFTAWDLGRTDDTAIWFFQVIAGEIRVVDYHASNLKTIEFYATLLRDWQKRHGTVYGRHWLPHDARPRTLAGGGKSILQQFEDHARTMGLGKFGIVPRLDRQEGIQAARATFPNIFFDKERCEDGIEALRSYRREWDEEKKCFNDNPVHDWSSHGSDAFRYLSLVWKHAKASEPVRSFMNKLLAGSVGQQSFGEMKTAFLDRKRASREQTLH